MRLCEIQNPITNIKDIGDKTAKLFAGLDIFSVGDLLLHFPREWEDRTKVIPLSQFEHHLKVHTMAQVIDHQWFGFGRMKTLKIIIDDTTATAELICFNRPFLEKSLPRDAIISITGSFYVKYGSLQSSDFDYQVISRSGQLDPLLYTPNSKTPIIPGSGIFPIYPLTAGLSQTLMRKTISKALHEYTTGLDNELPKMVIEKYQLMNKKDAIWCIHQPKKHDDLETAKRTLIFEELFQFQLALAKRFLSRHGELPDEASLEKNMQAAIETEYAEKEDLALSDENFCEKLTESQKKLLNALPFSLTIDQKQSILEINADFEKSAFFTDKAKNKSFSMSRLLHGDVGAGKTLVAFFACLAIIDSGGQCAILAPTELLARQHAENAAKILESTKLRLAFLTGNVKTSGRNQLLNALKHGEIDLIIGTHALFSRQVLYKNLSLVIIDEQHRFGVVQKNALLDKGKKILSSGQYRMPHLLMMSATPIPQTLALTVFGDMDISVIRSMPQGRLPIITHLTQMGHEQNVHTFVKNELKAGHQAYFVYPLIETSDEESHSNLKSAEEMFANLKKKVFCEYTLALIHSRIEESEQKQIMNDFYQNKIQILVATSVVEVGVDVPNATCMVVEHAERFGLAALHQLRGRVGRSKLQSHCFLIYAQTLTDIGKARLKVLFESTDGFYIAEQDLLLRGPGEVLGRQQSGYLTMKIADPVRDHEIMLLARKEAFNLLR